MYDVGSRQHLERAAREQARAVSIGEHTSLCRVLGKYKMYVDTRDESIAPSLLLDGIWESWITIAVARLVTQGMVAANVGANVGYYTLLLADLVGPTGKIHAFEPQPELAAMIGRSARANGFYEDRVVIHQAAVGSEHGLQTELSVNPWRNGYAYIRDASSAKHLVHGGGDPELVPEVTLDEVLPARRLDLLVMDCEGSEERAWDGMGKVLEENPRLAVVLEFTPMFLASPERFADKLTHYGHSLLRINEEGDLDPISKSELCAAYQTNIAVLR